MELVAATGLSHPAEIDRSYINKRLGPDTVRKYNEIYPPY